MIRQYRAIRVAMLSLALSLALAGVVALLGLMGALSEAYAAAPHTIRYVSATTGDDGPPANNCNQRTNPCRTIQRAVAVASSGDAILVAAGTYTDLHKFPAPAGYLSPPASGQITQVVLITKSLTISGGYSTGFLESPNPQKRPTIVGVPAPKKARPIVIVGAISPTIYGLRFANGNAAGLGGTAWEGEDGGGGIYVIDAAVTLDRNWVYASKADYGGGILLWNSSATLNANKVTTNTAALYGGGIFTEGGAPTLTGNTVVSNTASDFGGGLRTTYSDATIQGNTITSNTARIGGGASLNRGTPLVSGNTFAFNIAAESGGGFEMGCVNALVSDNLIMSNTNQGQYGGGVTMSDSEGDVLLNNTIISNTAYGGGGVYVLHGTAVLSGNTISSNAGYWSGGGLFVEGSDVEVSGNVVISNYTSHDGGGMSLSSGSNAVLVNNVVIGNEALDYGAGIHIAESNADLLHTTIAGNYGGDGSGIYMPNETMVGRAISSVVTMTNTILVSHTPGISVTGGNTLTIDSILWHNTPITLSKATTASVTILNEYEGDPCFDVDGYHLLGDSAALNRGIVAGVTVDIDNQARDANPDLGADERVLETIPLPIILNDY